MKPPPVAAYRLQLGPGFGFARCREVLPYLARLGVSHIYASPVFRARPGSDHGYDVCDHNAVNPELGSLEEFVALLEEARGLGLSWVQDIVPNHMAVSGDNPLLVDLLENGEASRFAAFFDIDWEHPWQRLRGRMLAPFLGDYYGRTLERGEIVLRYDAEGFFVQYYDLRLPVRLDSYPRILTHRLDRLRERLPRQDPEFVKLLGVLYTLKTLPTEEPLEERYTQIAFAKSMLYELYLGCEPFRDHVERNLAEFNGGEGEGPERFDLLDGLLAEQLFRLASWKVAGEEINYRRFFSINHLISMRVEEEAVFRHTHGLILDLVRRGLFAGLRVDHIDGLFDPSAYLLRLRDHAPEALVWVEKILAQGEEPPLFWPVQGTTGYDFLNACLRLFVRPESARDFDRIHAMFAGRRITLAGILPGRKAWIIASHMGGDVDNMARLVNSVSGRDRHGFDITFHAIKQAIAELLVHFPVYRTYLSHGAVRAADLTYIRLALRAARRARPELAFEFDFLERFLLLQFEERMREEDRRQWTHFVMRFQQVTGPLMAKGMEDTAFYLANRLLCLNEVGGDPDTFGAAPEAWHDFVRQRRERWPLSLNASATHDTKRGEDARARLAVLSEMPEAWEDALRRFSRVTARRTRLAPGRPALDPNDLYLLYQSLLGAWPFAEAERQGFVRRFTGFLVKALREGKENSNWLSPHESYEQAFTRFAEGVLRPGRRNAFLREFIPLWERVALHGVVASLAQTLLKIAAPGVPDFYQGAELWDFSLVDPDNRRPVDFAARARMLEDLERGPGPDPDRFCADLLGGYADGRIKLFLIQRALAARNRDPGLFAHGEYQPLACEGRRAGMAVAFLRRRGPSAAVAVVPRLTSAASPGRFPLGPFWEDARVLLPVDLPGPLVEALTGTVLSGGDALYLSDVLARLPVALFLAGEVAAGA
ncbi:MAG: malto-oligosyltrehalose synthase [Thermodesulfobacteriota bacterium]